MSSQISGKEIPFPPIELRRLVGPIEDHFYDNSEGQPIFPDLPDEIYDFVFDFGCGCGRLARQLIQQTPCPRKYIGVDLHRGMIKWCKKNLTHHAPSFKFYHQNVFNPGLNPHGSPKILPFPIEDNQATLCIAWSVFTHINERSTALYLNEFERILNTKGVLVSTWFLFDKKNFPMMQEWQNTIFISDIDPTNAVIYDKQWLKDTTSRSGLTITKIIPPTIRGFQWQIYMKKTNTANDSVNFPEDTAPYGIERPPTCPPKAHKIGM